LQALKKGKLIDWTCPDTPKAKRKQNISKTFSDPLRENEALKNLTKPDIKNVYQR